MFRFFEDARRVFVLYAALAVVVIVSGCKSSSPTQPAPNLANDYLSFSPKSVRRGEQVKVTWHGINANKNLDTLFFAWASNPAFFSPVNVDSVSSIADSVLFATVTQTCATGLVKLIVGADTVFSKDSLFVLTAPDPVGVDYQPKSGTAGTVVTLTGRNFDVKQSYSKVSLGGEYLVPKQITPTSMTIVVPCGSGVTPLTLVMDGDTLFNNAPFTIYQSHIVIDSFAPLRGPAKMELVIYCEGLPQDTVGMKVFFNFLPGRVDSIVGRKLYVRVPDSAKTGTVTISQCESQTVSTSTLTIVGTYLQYANIDLTGVTGNYLIEGTPANDSCSGKQCIAYSTTEPSPITVTYRSLLSKCPSQFSGDTMYFPCAENVTFDMDFTNRRIRSMQYVAKDLSMTASNIPYTFDMYGRIVADIKGSALSASGLTISAPEADSSGVGCCSFLVRTRLNSITIGDSSDLHIVLQ